MAREEDLQERYLEEMPPCLRDLFEQTGWEQDKCFANNAHFSGKSFTSILDFRGMQLPPPLLTEEERVKMREYRREAVKYEAKLFDRRRERYSDLILQVMFVMDRIQDQKEVKTLIETQCDHESLRERTLINEIDERADFSRTSQSATCEPDHRRRAWDVSSNKRDSNQEQFTKSFREWTKNNGEQSRRNDSQLGFLPNSVESMLSTSDESGIFKHQFTTKIDPRKQNKSASLGFEGMDFPLSSTMDKDTSEIKRPFSQLSAVASNGLFSDTTSDSTTRNKSVLFQKDRRGLEYDSLASTSLSVAFSDSSNSTVNSVIEARPRSTVQHQTIRNSGTDDTHSQDFGNRDQQSTTTQSTNPKTTTRPISSRQKPQSFRPSQEPLLSDQDKTLANLEKLRQKLLEEKQKQIDAMKQQELKRLRKQQKEQPVDLDHNYSSFHSSTPTRESERPRSNSMPSTRTSDLKQSPSKESEHHRVIDRSSPLRRPLSMPPGEMYSILELSGENLDFDAHDHNAEPESSSDKENHVVNEDTSVNRSTDVVVSEGTSRNTPARMNDEQNMHRPGFSQRKDLKSSAAPKGNHKFFVSNGRDKFAKLSAHAKGFLTRCLMKTDKVRGLIQTIKDTREVLVDISKEGTQTMQEKILKDNVESHLKVARGSFHDVFFKIPVKERMSYIAHSRSVARAKQAKRITRSTASQSKLSAVTLRAIQRRQEGLDHCHIVSSVRQTENTEVKLKPEAREERKRKNWNIRVLKPQQGHTSPPLPDKTRSKKPTSRPTTAPVRPLNSRMQKADAAKRPQTAETVRGNPERPSKLSLGGGNSNQSAKRPGRKSLGGISQQPRMVGALANTNRTAQPRAQKRLSLPESAQPRIKTSDVTQRPQTASEVKRSSRTLAANFAK